MTYEEAVNAWADTLLPEGIVRDGQATIDTTVELGGGCPTCDMGAGFEVYLEVPTESYAPKRESWMTGRPDVLHRWSRSWRNDEIDFAALMAELIKAAS